MDELDAKAMHETTEEAIGKAGAEAAELFSTERGASVFPTRQELAAEIERQMRAKFNVPDVVLPVAAVQPQEPTVGRIVHFVNREHRHLAAIITGVADDEADIHVFPYRTKGGEFAAAHDIALVEHDEEKVRNTWHWPERE
jgi:hypothetical protein